MERAGSAELAPSSAWPRPSRHSPSRRQGDCHARAQPVGEALVSWSGPAVSRLIHKVSGLRRYRPSRFLGEAAMTNAGPLAGTRRCISPHVFAIVMARSGRLLSALRPMAPSMPTHEGSRERRWSRDLPEVMGSRRRLTPRRGHVRRLMPPRSGVRKASPPTPNVARDLNPAPARHYPAWPYAAGSGQASCSAARPSPSRS
jgi:hypothetical protein